MKKENNNIEFSVLMSVYKNDKPNFVKIAIESILKQTLQPSQFVIMIDGQIDEKLEQVLFNYEKENKIIELHFKSENSGLGLTLKEGLNYCKYDYVARMDADDYSLPNRFEIQFKYLMKNKNISIIGSNIAEFTENIENINSIRKVPEKNEDIYNFAKSRNPFNHPSVVFRKKDVIAVGSYKNVRFLQDYFLWVDLLTSGYKGYNVQQNLVYMRADANLFKRRSGKKYIKIQIKLLDYMKSKKFINNKQYVKSKIIRTCSGYAPNWLRKFIFTRVLRKKVNNK